MALLPRPGLRSAWQIFTYPLYQPPEVFGILLSFVFFWWIVAPYEQSFGKANTLRVLAVTTITAALPVLAFGFLFGDGVSEVVRAGPVNAGPLFSVHSQILGVIAALSWAMRYRGKMSLFGAFSLSPVQIILLLLALSALHFLATTNITNLLADLGAVGGGILYTCLLYTSPSPRDRTRSRMPSSA